MAKNPKNPKETKPRPPKTPKEKADMKEKTAQRKKEFENAVGLIKNDYKKVWSSLNDLRNSIKAAPAEMQSDMGAIVSRLIRQSAQPDRRMKAEERIKARIAKLNEQREKYQQQLSEMGIEES